MGPLRDDEVTMWQGGDDTGPWCCYCGGGRNEGACECLVGVLVAAVYAEIGRFCHFEVDTVAVVTDCIAENGGETTVADAVAWVRDARADAERAYHADSHYPARDGA